MKRIIIIHSNMEIGGAETSLLGLLNAIDYNNYSVDLLLLNPVGELMKLIPDKVKILQTPNQYRSLMIPIREAIKNKNYNIALARIRGKLYANYYHKIKKKKNISYLTKQYSHKFSQKYLPMIEGKYDLGISFIDPHYIIQQKINADLKLAWLHTDFSRVDINKKVDYEMWSGCDYIVSVSEACKEAFDSIYPKLANKSLVIENILSREYVINQANIINVEKEINRIQDEIIICSIGRFSDQKNFDNIPNICKRIVNKGYKVKWVIIGYGSDENIIREKIKEENMNERVIILGKKENPYPYIKCCDIYVQPSRYEGKAVTVREAQMLNKPVIITNFVTAKSQVSDGYDGIIVPMDNEGCADGIINLINNKEKQKELIKNTEKMDYSNQNEVNKIYALIE